MLYPRSIGGPRPAHRHDCSCWRRARRFVRSWLGDKGHFSDSRTARSAGRRSRSELDECPRASAARHPCSCTSARSCRSTRSSIRSGVSGRRPAGATWSTSTCHASGARSVRPRSSPPVHPGTSSSVTRATWTPRASSSVWTLHAPRWPGASWTRRSRHSTKRSAFGGGMHYPMSHSRRTPASRRRDSMTSGASRGPSASTSPSLSIATTS